jgi:hypothetical protein
MILDVHREALVVGVVGGTLGHRPGPEDAFHLEPEIEVQAPRGVLVDDEESAPAAGSPAGRFRGALELPFGAVGLEMFGVGRTLGGHGVRWRGKPLTPYGG